MNIGFLCGGCSWGGLEMNVLRLSLWLTERGWPIIIYADSKSPIFEKAAEDNLKRRSINSRFKYRDLFSALGLASLATTDNLQIMIVHSNKQIPLAVIGKKLSRQKFKLVYQQHMHVGGSKRDLIHSWLYSNLDGWIAPLNMFKKRVSKQTTIAADKIFVIPFGIDLSKFQEERPDKITARRSLNLPENEIIIGTVGRLDKHKGQDVLIRAAAKLHSRGINAHLLIVGDPTTGEGEEFAIYLLNLTNQLKLSNYVHFRFHIEDIQMAYAALDIFALTTYSETYGMVTIEAMASGLPVVGTNDGGTVEIIAHDKSGILVEPGNDNVLAEALFDLAKNPDKRDRLGKQAAAEAADKFSHIGQCTATEDLFEHLTRTSKP